MLVEVSGEPRQLTASPVPNKRYPLSASYTTQSKPQDRGIIIVSVSVMGILLQPSLLMFLSCCDPVEKDRSRSFLLPPNKCRLGGSPAVINSTVGRPTMISAVKSARRRSGHSI
ncbi:uncharacterized protein BO66DRAFT_101274 [Aspergillus aculeatinus CBS 121060]|uniref:Uncharacterized protein n=1 Tax=Aspergillus aculeatinus CBS 121060 TaxID=1448322 RepID=A0ACD1H763_9EURO|nr:hypothetical protein BO66DRAFT_101274 [Aspergillus aculeatinus CBS 121060]RAH69429.1 hypothetical protein BO66DRAFT_101274 [Aspergillus aculeatinus CBS 121060]